MKKKIRKFRRNSSKKIILGKYYYTQFQDKIYIGRLKNFENEELTLFPISELIFNGKELVLEEQEYYKIYIHQTDVNGPFETENKAIDDIIKKASKKLK